MSAGALFQECLRLVRAEGYPADTESDVLKVLEADRAALAFLAEARWDARDLPEAITLRRGAALYLLCAAGSLADDLVDGDATYLDPPIRFGPSAQYLLHSLCFAALADAGLSAPVLAVMGRDLARAAAWGHAENRVLAWDAPTYREATEHSSGDQFAALLAALWEGSQTAPLARPVAVPLVSAARVANDIVQHKDRFWSQSDADRASLVRWARDELDRAAAHELHCTRVVARSIGPVLGEVAC